MKEGDGARVETQAHHNTPTHLTPQTHSALVVERHVDTGDAKLECWCLCTNCRKRVRPDAFLGKHCGLRTKCDECRAAAIAYNARAQEDEKPASKAANAALIQQADDMEAAVTKVAVAKVADNWSKFKSVPDVVAWAKKQPEADCVKTGTMFICAAVKEARARFAKPADEGGGGPAE
jgi:hypothetical protein